MDNLIVDLDKVLDDFEAEGKYTCTLHFYKQGSSFLPGSIRIRLEPSDGNIMQSIQLCLLLHVDKSLGK